MQTYPNNDTNIEIPDFIWSPRKLILNSVLDSALLYSIRGVLITLLNERAERDGLYFDKIL